MELLLMATSTGLTKHSRILIYGDVQTRCGAHCKTDLTDLMVLDGRTDHIHEIEDDRKVQRSKLRQACKRKAVDDITERPQKLIIAECGKTENDTLVPEDISTIRQVVYQVRRRTQPKLPKSREEMHVNLKDYMNSIQPVARG